MQPPLWTVFVCTPEEVAVLEPYQYGNFGPDAAGCWPAPEFGENLDTKNMGNLGLTETEIDAIVAFMEAMTDQ